MKNVRIEGIRKTNVKTWAVVGSRPNDGHDGGRTLVIVGEFEGTGAKARAIRAAGTNRVVTTVLDTLLVAA